MATEKEGAFVNYAIGGFVTLVVGSIGWLFLTVTTNNTSISNLQSQTNINNNQTKEINLLKNELRDLSNKLSTLERDAETNKSQWRNINKTSDQLHEARRILSAVKKEVSMLSGDLSKLEKFHLTEGKLSYNK